jgi:hypothetical protein
MDAKDLIKSLQETERGAIRKLARIEMLAEQLLYKGDHDSSCPADDDTGYGPCTCGIQSHNHLIRRIREECMFK